MIEQLNRMGGYGQNLIAGIRVWGTLTPAQLHTVQQAMEVTE